MQHKPANRGFSNLCLSFLALSPQAQERPVRVEVYHINWESLWSANCVLTLSILCGAGGGCYPPIEFIEERGSGDFVGPA